MTDGDLAILIVAYGHAQSLPATLKALQRQAIPPHAVVVVDNGDGSSAAVAQAALPAAVVLHPGQNLGFGGGCLLAAAHTTAPYLALVNPDVVLEPDWSTAVLDTLRDEGIGIAGGLLVFPDGRIQHAGGEIRWPLALTRHRGYGMLDLAPFSSVASVGYVTGAALALRRSVWDAVGGLDPLFFPAYFEEVDLCLRVADLGLAIRYVPTARGTHIEASGLGRTSEAYYRLYHLNRLRLLWKHRTDDWLLAHWLPAELAHLRVTADDAEIDGLLWAYQAWQAAFVRGDDWRAPIEGWELPGTTETGETGELDWALGQLAHKRTVQPQAFTSRWPLLPRLRAAWNRIATESYLRPILQQQNDYNAALHDLAIALTRQRRTTDGAVLAQAMLLAKVLRKL